MMAKAFIGTSGWQYPDFTERFYPSNLAKVDQLSYYADQFPSVEVNNTFYHLPKAKTVENWVNKVPEKFIFAVKASRYITHMKNLLDPEETLPKFFERIDSFGKHCGPILFQLPPNWALDFERLRDFLPHLPGEYRYTIELRNKTWLVDKVFSLLRQYKVAFCIYEINYRQSPILTTADFVYIRLHGPGRAYADPYAPLELERWAVRINQWLSQDKDVYCYFDNTLNGYAWVNAQTLLKLTHS
jgi:uncharacterized protein YecE (DUF72 family)